MDDILFWTWVVGGTPLALALVQRAVEWSCDLAQTRMIARGTVAKERPASDSWHMWMRA